MIGLYLAKSAKNLDEQEYAGLISSLQAIAAEAKSENAGQGSAGFESSWQLATNSVASVLKTKHQRIYETVASGQAGSPLLNSIAKILRSPENTDQILTHTICNLVNTQNLVDNSKMFEICLEFDSKTPTLVLISPGTDPAFSIKQLAELNGIASENFLMESLGQGKQENILKIIESHLDQECWILVQNLHLYTTWIPTLMEVLQSNEDKFNPKFRLFLSTEPHQNIPGNLLENSIKINFEAPPGLKNNILRTLNGWKLNNLFANGGATRARSLYALAFLHAICLERKRYDPIGFVNGKNYEFNSSDLRSGLETLEEILRKKSKTTKKGGISWTNLIGIFSSTIYGGRLNSLDNSILHTHLYEMFNDKLLSKTSVLAEFESQAENLSLSLPTTANIDDYIHMTEEMVPNDNPTILGLSSNVDKTIQKKRLNKMILNLN